MKRFFALCGGSLLVVLLLAVAVRAEEIKNQYFTLDLPSGWNVEGSEENSVMKLLNVSDASGKNFVSITIFILPEPMSTKELRAMSSDSLKTSDVRIVRGPVFLGETYAMEVSQGEKNAFHYFTAAGKLASLVSFTGDGSKELLQKHLKPVDPKLFPASYEDLLLQQPQ